jgi:hypothetical protein
MSDEDTAGMDEEDWAPEFITLDYEDDTSERCEVLGIFECDGSEYIALVPDSDQESVYIYGYNESEDGSFDLIDIDDEEFEAASAAYEAIMESDDE